MRRPGDEETPRRYGIPFRPNPFLNDVQKRDKEFSREDSTGLGGNGERGWIPSAHKK